MQYNMLKAFLKPQVPTMKSIVSHAENIMTSNKFLTRGTSGDALVLHTYISGGWWLEVSIFLPVN
jgi:hypothetical protein